MVIFCLGCGPQIVQEFDDLGNLISKYEVNSNSQVKHGNYIGYHANGDIFEECIYVDGQLNGQRVLYYENGNKQAIEHYQSDLLQGAYEEYYSNGQLSFTGSYKNNEMEGLWIKYDEEGNLAEKVHFENNEENGPFKEYHPNGKLAAEGSYLGGDFEHGELRIYDEQGVLVKRMECDKGVCRTTWTLDSTNNLQ